MLGGLGGFAGFFDASALKGYAHPVLATSTDGVGTKVAIAQALDRHDTIGSDLVGMLVDDLVVTGRGAVVRHRLHRLRQGGSRADRGYRLRYRGRLRCRWLLPRRRGRPPSTRACSAPTNTTSREPPPASSKGTRSWGLTGSRWASAVVAMASSGLHSNGYSLVRHVLLEQAGWSLERHIDELGRTLGEELLEPTKVYALDVLALIREVQCHALSHITGGGLANNLARVIPGGMQAV